MLKKASSAELLKLKTFIENVAFLEQRVHIKGWRQRGLWRHGLKFEVTVTLERA